jgi:hypothetical protein
MNQKIMNLVVELKDEIVSAKGNFAGVIEADGEVRLFGSFNSGGTSSPAVSLLNAIVTEGGVNPDTVMAWMVDNFPNVVTDYINVASFCGGLEQ